MFQNLINKFVSWFYNKLEAEKVRRDVAAKAEQQAKRDEAQRKNSAYLLKMYLEKQERCTHKKGGKLQSGWADYNVMNHRFADGRIVVRCFTCSKEWSKAKGNLDEGLKLAAQSTNTATASETTNVIKDRQAPVLIEKYTNEQDGKTLEESERNEPYAPYISKSYWDKLESIAVEKLRKVTRKLAPKRKKKEAQIGLNNQS